MTCDRCGAKIVRLFGVAGDPGDYCSEICAP